MAARGLSRLGAGLLLGSAALLALAGVGRPVARAGAPSDPETLVPRRVVLLLLDQVSFEEAMGVGELRRLARAGGVALAAVATSDQAPAARYWVLASGGAPERSPRLPTVLGRRKVPTCVLAGGSSARVADLLGPGVGTCGRLTARAALVVADLEAPALAERRLGQPRTYHESLSRSDVLLTAGRVVRTLLGDPQLSGARVRVLVVTPAPSSAMVREGDEVTPVFLADGEARDLLEDESPLASLTSDTTRQSGLVSLADVAPTVLSFLQVPVPAEMTGRPIRVGPGPAPTALHRLHLEQRRIRLPLQLGEVAFVSALGLAGVVVLLLLAVGRCPPWPVLRAMRFLALAGASLGIVLYLGGLLPRLTYPVAVPFVALGGWALARLAERAGEESAVGPFAFLGLAGLALLVVDLGFFGGRAARIPLVGGTMFDGVRFFGLPNVFIALLLASAAFVATLLPPLAGFLVLLGAGLLGGLPSLGANLGASATLFAAAGLWWVLRTRPRFGLREASFAAGVMAVGLGAVLLAARLLPGPPTHVTEFVERGGGLAAALRTYGHRLALAVGQVREVPSAAIPILGLAVVLGLVLRAPGPIGRGLELAGQAWRHALIVVAAAGIVAFFANDTGATAAAPVFLYAMAGMAYPAFLAAEAEPEVRTGSPVAVSVRW